MNWEIGGIDVKIILYIVGAAGALLLLAVLVGKWALSLPYRAYLALRWRGWVTVKDEMILAPEYIDFGQRMIALNLPSMYRIYRVNIDSGEETEPLY